MPAAEAIKPATQNGQPTPQVPATSAVRMPVADNVPEVPAVELTEEQKAAKAAADAAAEAAVRKAEADQKAVADFQTQLQELQLLVTKGEWPLVAESLVRFSEADRNLIYDKLLQSLVLGTPDSPRSREGQIIGERILIRAMDVIAIAELCPLPAILPVHRLQLGQLAMGCQAEGEANYAFAAALRQHTANETTHHKLTKRLAAHLLFGAGRVCGSSGISSLPLRKLKQVWTSKHSIFCLMLSSPCTRKRRTEQSSKHHGWRSRASATQPEFAASDAPGTVHAEQPKSSENAVESSEAKPDELSESERDGLRQKALRRAVMLVPRLREELGQEWLAESFTRKAERGRRILNGIGAAAARNMNENAANTDERLATLKLQRTAVEAVLTHSGNSADQWAPALHLMAVNWLREATYSSLYDTSTSRGPRMQRDEFGNYFWSQETAGFGRQMQAGMPQAIPAGKVLDARPSDAWLKFLEPTFYPTLAISTARLHLRVKEEANAFPYIESLAKTHPAEARELIEIFLNTWAENHDPNSDRRRTGMYMFSFGYNERLSGIPLTRSHQERSLRELSTWVQRIRALELEDIDEKWISSAFTKVHSSAEVYRQDDLEAVFGNVQDMQPQILASFLQSMRNNLSTVWRAPQVQQDSGTNRKKKDMEAEVVRGYGTALTLCGNAPRSIRRTGSC